MVELFMIAIRGFAFAPGLVLDGSDNTAAGPAPGNGDRHQFDAVFDESPVRQEFQAQIDAVFEEGGEASQSVSRLFVVSDTPFALNDIVFMSTRFT